MSDFMGYGHGYGFGMGGGMWFLTILFWVIFLAGVYLVLRGFLDRKDSSHPMSHPTDEPALEILRKRFARGEIDEDTFKRMKKDLEE